MTRSFLEPGAVAVVTGAATGIGRAACRAFADRAMKVVLADNRVDRLEQTRRDLVATFGSDGILTKVTDVADAAAVEALAETAFDHFGRVDLLMNNAASRIRGGDGDSAESWRGVMDVNFWAAVYAEQAFLPRMQALPNEKAIINTGSKQGITNPPGNLIYNVTKSALKTYTEGLQHRLRNTEGCEVSAHLLVPGWTTTGDAEPRPGAWMPEQVVARMIDALDHGDFYILCEDNEVTADMDAQRILWASGDMIENRPPLSRWHPDWAEIFKAEQDRGDG